jgi:DNA-binding NtrC family response regulator
MDRLREYSWPGNIRELQNVLRQALLRLRGRVLLSEFLPELPHAPDRIESRGGLAPCDRNLDLKTFVRDRLAAGTTSLLQETQQWMEEIVLPLVLEHTQGNRRQAARILGIARQTLRSKLREMGVTIQSSVDFGENDES